MADNALWDAAIHVYDDAYPVRPGLTAKPPHAPISTYFSAHERMGISNVVLSQASVYGFDNSLLLDTLDRLSGRGRGIVVLPPTIALSELRSLHARGVRGVRFLMSAAGALHWEDIAPWAARATELDWLLKFQVTSDQFVAASRLLATLPCKVILDVYPGALSLDAGSVALLDPMLEDRRTWLSFVAPQDDDKAFNDAARVLINSHPKQCLWASNWPAGLSASQSPTQTGANWLTQIIGHPLAMTMMENAGQLFDK
jgi:D-galactarolactone isomerase